MKEGREIFLTMIWVMNLEENRRPSKLMFVNLNPIPLKVHVHPGQRSHSECFLPIFSFLLGQYSLWWPTCPFLWFNLLILRTNRVMAIAIELCIFFFPCCERLKRSKQLKTSSDRCHTSNQTSFHQTCLGAQPKGVLASTHPSTWYMVLTANSVPPLSPSVWKLSMPTIGGRRRL